VGVRQWSDFRGRIDLQLLVVRSGAGQRHSPSVNSPVEPPYNPLHINLKGVANSQKCAHRIRAALLYLLPVAGRETEANHVLLAIAFLLPQLADPSA